MWQFVGKLHRRNSFSGEPFNSLHKRIRVLAPDVTEISRIGVTPATNKYLRKALVKWLRRERPWMRVRSNAFQSAIGMAMLQYSPCDVEGDEYEDFHVYVRVSEQDSSNVRVDE